MASLSLDGDIETSWRYAGWRVVLACFVMATFAWGFGFYGQSVFLAELPRLHGWPSSLVSTAITAYYFLGAALVAFVSDLLRRLGPKGLVLAGIASLGASAASLTVIAAPWQLFAAYLVMAFGWAAMSLGAISNILGLWFDHKRGLAISLALNGASFAGVALVPLLVLLVGTVGFADAVLLAVAAMVLLLGPMTFLWIDRPGVGRKGNPDGEGTEAASRTVGETGWTKARALRSVHFWGISGSFALALLVQVGFIVHQIAFLEPMLGRAQAGIAVSVTAIMALIGRVGLGVVIDRLDQRLTTAISLASQAAALFVLTQTTSIAVLFAACAVYGLSVGNIITLPSLIIQREFETASFGLLIGLSTAVCQIVYAAGPGLLGLLRDATGGYMVPLVLCAALDLAAAAIILAGRSSAPAKRLDG
ncbi:MAG: MFS transporter [Hyphomicrobiales bacterium]